MEEKVYRREFQVLSPDSTRERLLKPSVAMKYFQEMSDAHCIEVGNGYQTLRDRDMAFISVRTSITFHNTPKVGDRFLCETWQRGLKGVQWLRDCVMKNEAGEHLVESTTGWVLMNLTERRALRSNKVNGMVTCFAPELALTHERLRRMKLPEDMPVVARRLVEYCDIDYFGHLNNCVYADIIMNALPISLEGQEVWKLDISFINEATQGDVLEIRAVEQDGVCWLAGYHDRGRCFEAMVEVRPL